MPQPPSRRPPQATPEQGRRAELDRRALVADLATSTRVSEWTVTRLMSEAVDLCTRFAAGVDALERGEISRQHLAVIHDAGDPISDDAARAAFLTLALDRATTLTPGRLAPVLKVIAERFQDRTLAERHTDAVARRGVEIVDLPDHMAALTLINDATLIHGIHDRLTAQARAAVAARQPADHTADGERRREAPTATASGGGRRCGRRRLRAARRWTPAPWRSCAPTSSATCCSPGPQDCIAGDGLDAIRATVQVTVPVLTAPARHRTRPARRLRTHRSRHRPPLLRQPRLGTRDDLPVTGAVLAVDRYRPSPALDRFLRARDERCRFPGCRHPVWRCDLDHTIDHAHGGPTCHATSPTSAADTTR